MLWLMLLLVAIGLHLQRWTFFGRPRYPLQIIPPQIDAVIETSEFAVGIALLMAFVFAVPHPRVKPLRVICFLLTVTYHVLVTAWARVWWRARLWNTLIVIGYTACLWWLVLLYAEAGQVPVALTFFSAAYKSTDIYLVYRKGP